MVIIYNNIDRASGAPELSVSVSLQLLWDTASGPVAKVDESDTMIQGSYSTSSDENGYWETEVVDNDSITPIDSVYRIIETTKASNISTYYISVPDAATPVPLWVGDLIVATPDWIV